MSSWFQEAGGNYLELDTRVRGSLLESVDTMYPFIPSLYGFN